MPDAPTEHTFRTERGTIIVREGNEFRPWLLTWLPDRTDDEHYPGFTLSSRDSPHGMTFPTTSFRDAAEWAAAQPWARNEPANPHPDDALLLQLPSPSPSPAPPDDGLEWRLRIIREPDDSFSWWVFVDGLPAQSGVAPTLDDAKLASISDLYPPSEES
jgi:hypothetical protein